MILTASITRATVPGGPLADLALELPGILRLVEVAPGAVVWRRAAAESRWVHGRFLSHATKDAAQLRVVVRALGASAAALESNTALLVAAFEQWSYLVSATIDGVLHSWRCEPADYQPVEDALDKFALAAFQQTYSFSCPRAPVPVAGSI